MSKSIKSSIKTNNEYIRVDEQTKINEIEWVEKEAFDALQKFIKDMKWEQVVYLTKEEWRLLKKDSDFEKLEKNITDTYEFFQWTKLADNLWDTENLQNVAEMIDDFSEKILFIGDNPIIKYNFNIKTRKNLITGMSLKLSDLIWKDKMIWDEIAKIANWNLLSAVWTTLSWYFNKSFSDNIEQYRLSLEWLNKVPSSNLKTPEDVKSVIDQLIENNWVFDKAKLKKVEILDIKEIWNLLGTNLINWEIASNVSAMAEINSSNSDLWFEDKAKLFFNSSMWEKVKSFFESNTMLAWIISFLLSTFMWIDLNKLMWWDKLTEDKIPGFRKRIVEWWNIKNAEKLLRNKDWADLATANRLYWIKDLLKYSDDKDLKYVFFEIQDKSEFIKIHKNLTWDVIDSNMAITENMDKTINLYYDFLSQKSSDKQLNIDDFIKSKKKESKAEVPPTKIETKSWKEKSPEKKWDYITAITWIWDYKYETKINKNWNVTIRSNVPEFIKYVPENEKIGKMLNAFWNNEDFMKWLNNKEKIIEIIWKTIKGDWKFNNRWKITIYPTEDKKMPLTFTTEGSVKTENDTKKEVLPTVAWTVSSIYSTENKHVENIEKDTKKISPKIIQKTTEEIIESEKVENMTLLEMNKRVPDISKKIDIQESNFIIKYDKNITIKVNKNNSIFVKIKWENNKYNLLEFQNSKAKYLVNKIFAGNIFYAWSLEEKVIKPLREALKPIVKQIDNSSINLWKSEDWKEDYGELTLQKKYSTEVKTIEEKRKELDEDKKEDKVSEINAKKETPEKVKKKTEEQKKNNIAYENEKDGTKFIRYKNIIWSKMLWKLWDKKFSIKLKKIKNKNPVIFIELGVEKFQSEIIKKEEDWTWSNVFDKTTDFFTDKEYSLKFNWESEISVNSEADIGGMYDVGDFNINPEFLIREINNNKWNKIIVWDKSPTPWTKMVFKKYN